MGKKKCRIRQIFDNHVTVRSKGSTINRFKDFLRKRYFEIFFFFWILDIGHFQDWKDWNKGIIMRIFYCKQTE